MNRFLVHIIQALIAIHFALGASSAFALTTLKQVQVSNGSQVDLLFDGKVRPDQIKTEFFNDIIQVSVSDAAVYPAKISSINGESLSKIFAYQYAPKLVRCRLTVKGKAEEFKDTFQIKPSGKMLSLRLSQGSDKLTVQASAPAKAEPVKVAPAEQQPAEQIKISEADEKALLERVMKSPPAPAPAAAKEESAQSQRKQAAATKAVESRPLAGGKPLPSPWSALGKLLIVVALFLGFAVVVRKFKGGSSEKAGFLSALNRFARGTLGGHAKMIEVVSTHHLGPKKSIAVVKVAGRTLVLGVSNESINLITQIDGQQHQSQQEEENEQAAIVGLGGGGLDALDLDLGLTPAPKAVQSAYGRAGTMTPGAGATAAGNPMFADLLNSTATKPQLSNTRAQIRSRLEGLKQL